MINKMNPLIFFDYCFYKIANYYRNIYVLGYLSVFSGIMFVSLIQLFNIVILLMLSFPLRFNIIYFGIGYFILLTLNFIRYKKIVTFSVLHERWKKEESTQKVFRNILVIVYIVLTFVFSVIVTS